MNGNGLNGSGSFLVNISKYGAASVIAVYLAWQLAGNLPEIKAMTQENSAKLDTVMDQHESLDILPKLIRGLCLNDADTAEERLRCNP